MKTKDQILLENIYDEVSEFTPKKDISSLKQRLSEAITESDSYGDVAMVIAQIIKEDYGSHIVIPFKQKLNEYLPDPVNEK